MSLKLFTDDIIEQPGLTGTESTGNDIVTIKNEERVKDHLRQVEIQSHEKFLLKTEAFLLRLAYTNNKLLSLSNSRTQILAHQVESVHRVINSLNQRFLIADEVGLGKTIEAGLVIKELIFRHGYNKILIICPASLIMQWQNELQNKFNEEFTIVDRSAIQKIRRQNRDDDINPWLSFNKIICSLDFIKAKSNIDYLKRSEWDVVIMDEAHRLRRDSFNTTLSYNIAEILSAKTKAFLLLTATPFRGKLEELYYLIRLVDKNVLGPFQTFFNTYCLNEDDVESLQEKISSVIIRRTKKEVGGFTERKAKTIRFELYPEERVLYDATTRYIVEEFNRAMHDENRAVGFVMTVFQKLLDSSSFALLSALKKRRSRLSSIISANNDKKFLNRLIEKKFNAEQYDIDDGEDPDELIEDVLKKTLDEIKEEIFVLDSLIKTAESIDKNHKGEKLRELLFKLRKHKCSKVIIFTQFRATQQYLKELLRDFNVQIFNGSLEKEQKEAAIREFRESGEVLISTEAGGEGRNLQFCNVLINYDLPWSPLKIEQRIGRIHRFGQLRDVYIYNFSTKDTVAERVLQVLTKKLKLFEKSIGTPDILLGQIEDGLNLNRIFMDMASRRESVKKINRDIDDKINSAKESYEKLSGLAVAKKMDFNYDEYYRITLEERDYCNNRIENFVETLRKHDSCVDRHLGKKSKNNDLYIIKKMPPGHENFHAHKYGTFKSSIALNDENIEFLAFGNPVVDNLVNHCCSSGFAGHAGVKIIEYRKKFTGIIFYYMVTFYGSSEFQEIIPVFVSSNNSIKDYEIEEIENISTEKLDIINYDLYNHAPVISRIKNSADKYFASAKEKILEKIFHRVSELNAENFDSVAPEIEKIRDSYSKSIKEYEEQLMRQKCRMKWFKKDMKSAITRTENKIKKEKEEMERLLAMYNGYLDVRHSVELVNAGILITIEA